MKKGFLAFLLMLLTVLPAMAAPNNTSGPWGIDAGGFRNLSTALVSPATVGKTIVVSKPMAINGMTISGNRLLKVLQGGRIDTATGKILTFAADSDFDAGNYVAFGGGGSVVGLKKPCPDWWGGNASTDSTAAVKSAFAACKQGKVRFSQLYPVSDTITVTYTGPGDNTSIEGLGKGTGLVWNGPNDKPMINYVGVTGGGWYTMTTIREIYLYNGNSATGLIGIQLGNPAGTSDTGVGNVSIRDVETLFVGTGIYIARESDQITIDSCHIRNYTVAAVDNEGGSGVRVINSHLQDGTSGSTGVISKYSAITVSGCVIQGPSINGVLITNATAFSVTNNYTESTSGLAGSYWVKVVSSAGGYIGQNEIGGYQGANLVYVDAASKDINIGPQHHSVSGGQVNTLITVETGASGIQVIGKQTTTGAVPTMTGTFVTKTFGSRFVVSKIGSLGVSDTNNYVNLNAGATGTIFAITPGSCYLVYANNATSGYGYAGVVSAPVTGATAEIFKFSATDTTKFNLTVSGLNVNATNSLGSTQTIQWDALRIF